MPKHYASLVTLDFLENLVKEKQVKKVKKILVLT